MKTCFRCKTSKSLEEFHKGKGKDGKHSWCKTCVSANRAQVYRDNPESRRKDELWHRYRLRPSDVEDMLERQNNTCLLCPKVFVQRKDYHIDHNHTTGEVRGILCESCNRMLGWYEKRILIVNEYLGL